jgi:hypothetical protein
MFLPQYDITIFFTPQWDIQSAADGYTIDNVGLNVIKMLDTFAAVSVSP